MREKIMVGVMTLTVLATSAFLLTSCNNGVKWLDDANTLTVYYGSQWFLEYNETSSERGLICYATPSSGDIWVRYDCRGEEKTDKWHNAIWKVTLKGESK